MQELFLNVERDMVPIDFLIGTWSCGGGDVWSQVGNEPRECKPQTSIFAPIGLMKAKPGLSGVCERSSLCAQQPRLGERAF